MAGFKDARFFQKKASWSKNFRGSGVAIFGVDVEADLWHRLVAFDSMIYKLLCHPFDGRQKFPEPKSIRIRK